MVFILGTIAYAITCSNLSRGTYTDAYAEAYISNTGLSGSASGTVNKQYPSTYYYIGLNVTFKIDNDIIYYKSALIVSLDPTVTTITISKSKPSGQHSIVWSYIDTWLSLNSSVWYYDTGTMAAATTAGYCII